MIRSIKIDEKEGKVFITGCSNNVFPHDYERYESNYLTETLKEKGRKAVELELLKGYESGTLQKGNNKYTKALKVLKYVFDKEYDYYNWRKHNLMKHEEWEKERKRRETKGFDDLLLKALNYKFSKQKYIIKKDYFGREIYGKRNTRSMSWTNNKHKATKYDFKNEAEDVKQYYHNGSEFIVEKYN